MKDSAEYQVAKIYQAMHGTLAAAKWLASHGVPFFMAQHMLVRN